MLTDLVNDQVDVVCRSFLGLTVACARCHDHKFDPISQADYYGLAGIFFSTRILPGPGPKTNGSPMLRTPLLPPAEVARRERLPARLKEIEAEAARLHEEQAAAVAKALLSETPRYLLAAHDARATGTDPARLAAERGLRPWALRRWLEYAGPAGSPNWPAASWPTAAGRTSPPPGWRP
jgi:hypothetical protein